MVGGFVSIKWRKAGRLPSQVDISLQAPGCVGAATRLAVLTPNDGSETVHIPPTVADNYYSIRVGPAREPTHGCSERFHVLLRYTVTEPARGSAWRAGTTRAVRWRSDRPGGPTVNISLYRPGAILGSCLVRRTPNDGEQPVTIPADTAPGYYRLMMSDSSDSSCGGRDGFETFSGEFSVTSP